MILLLLVLSLRLVLQYGTTGSQTLSLPQAGILVGDASGAPALYRNQPKVP